MSRRRHLFISHRFKDDESVDGLTKMLSSFGWDVRNSSIRLKQANEQRVKSGEIPIKTLQRLLRMKISWSQTVVVIIGKATHRSDWVDYEIEEANRQGKRIVGVYALGEQKAEIPDSLEKYASAIVAWSRSSIIDAIDEGKTKFQNSDGSQRPPINNVDRRNC